MVTTFDLDEYVYRALRAGAHGFLLKATSPERLAGAVRTVAAGESVVDPNVTQRLIEHFLARPELDSDSARRLERLSERELQVLRLLARGMTNAEMGQELFLSDATIRRTSRACWASSASAAASRRSWSPTRRVSCGPGSQPTSPSSGRRTVTS